MLCRVHSTHSSVSYTMRVWVATVINQWSSSTLDRSHHHIAYCTLHCSVNYLPLAFCDSFHQLQFFDFVVCKGSLTCRALMPGCTVRYSVYIQYTPQCVALRYTTRARCGHRRRRSLSTMWTVPCTAISVNHKQSSLMRADRRERLLC